MKVISPNIAGITISLFATLIIVIFSLMIIYLRFNFSLLILIAASVLFFIVLYFIIYKLLKHFIINKLKPIYKTIYSTEISKEENHVQFHNKDFLSVVDKEVSNWANKKTKEIDHLIQLEKYRKEFLGNVSHELKTPIFNIQGYILTLLDGGIEDPAINRLYLERTEKNVNRMISIVEDLEAISRLESGELTLEYENFNIFQLVKEAFENNEIKAKEKSIKLSFASNIEKSLFVSGDKRRIFQVVNNLIDNSIKYGKENGQTTVEFFDIVDKVLIDISDNGIGIDEKHISRLFERFYRIDKSRSREQGGTGLGLAIVKHIIEGHNQSIKVTSTPGSGTSFSFTLQKVK